MFGRRKRDDATPDDAVGESTVDETAAVLDDDVDPRPDTGPYELTELDEHRDDLLEGRLDLGSVLVPVPDGGQLQVEMTTTGAPQAVHVVTQHGRITVAAFAAPKSPGQWREVATELADSLRSEKASVSVESGPWGREVVASTANGDLRFVGVDGHRWMIRAVATGPAGTVDSGSPLVQQVRVVVEGTVVDRGTEPHPVRTPLPITLPAALAEQLAAVHQQQLEQAQQAAAQPQPAPQAQPAPPAAPAPPAPRRGASGSAMQQLG